MSSLIQTFVVIVLAELGDKSQLVCLALASRYPAWQVWIGAVLAFAVLDAIAVTLGAAVAAVLGTAVLGWIAAGAFAVFGLLALFGPVDEEAVDQEERTGRSGILVAAMALSAAELGDKTQLAVATFATVHPPGAVWLGATLALAATSGLAVVAGHAVLSRLPRALIQRASGVLFLLAAASMVWL